MKQVLIFLIGVCCYISNAKSQITNQPSIDSSKIVIELNNGNLIEGKKVSDDGREIGVITADKGLVFIPKFEIRNISFSGNLAKIAGNVIFDNPHPSRYLYSPSGITLKKGHGYVQAIYYLVYQGQYALSDHISVGLTTSYIGAPLLVNFKYSTKITKEDDKSPNWYFTTGFQGGGAWFIPRTYMGVVYAGLTYGTAESNVTINAGYLGLQREVTEYRYDPVNGYKNVVSTSNSKEPAISFSWNQRISKTASFLGEFWVVNKTLVGGPGMRFYSGKKNALDIAVLGGTSFGGGSGIFGIPFVSFTRKIGGN